MKPARNPKPNRITKAATGITGFDDITGGGLPLGRTTLLVGGPGSGKTIFALQFLVHGARARHERSIFVAFEETSKRIVANADSFGWKLNDLRREDIFFVDAQPSPDLVQSGTFDLGGLLATLEALTEQMKARRIVFDALDIVLALMPDESTRRREVYRLHEWLLDHEMTGLITAKAGGDEVSSLNYQQFGFMQFMVDCAVILSHTVVSGVSQRNLRVQKYRGTTFDENESPLLIGTSGLQVDAIRNTDRQRMRVSNERVSSGVKRLDTMLGGGYYRGASVLITGFPGTAKTTLAGAFVEAACRRGERTLFISFDSDVNEVMRDLASVGIQLHGHQKSGRLQLASARTITGSAEAYLVRIKTLATEHGARCLVIDPMSTWARSSQDSRAHSVAERLTDWTKASGITSVCTSLIDEITRPLDAGSGLDISTLADTWIQLSYLMQAGERNRGLSIIKSRGTAHSNQVRELVLSDDGVTLADTYSAGGEVLMGTLRWEKERAERAATEAAEVGTKLRRVRLGVEEAELKARVRALQIELQAKHVERALMSHTTQIRKGELSRGRTHLDALRGADSTSLRKSARIRKSIS